MLTQQEMFDAVARHLAAQGFRAFQNAFCAYLDKYGAKCSFGIFIPNEKYDKNMEGDEISSIINEWLSPSYFEDINPKFLFGLQMIHDKKLNWFKPINMENALRDFAEKYDLSWSIIDKLDFGLIIPNRLDGD